MSGNPLKIKIAYLYPDLLYGACDIANINAFIQRATQRDIEVQLCEIQRNDKIQSAKYDFFYIGGTNLGALGAASKCLNKNKEELIVAMQDRVPMLAVCNGYILFGRSFQLYNKVETTGIRLLNVKSYSAKERTTAKLCGYCDFLKHKTVVGYKNWNIQHIIAPDAIPFLKIKSSFNKVQDIEGTRHNFVIGTSITSALLAQNPELCDFFIIASLKAKYKCTIPLMPLVDDIEWFSHKYMLESK